MTRVARTLKIGHFFVTDLFELCHHILKAEFAIRLGALLTLPDICRRSSALWCTGLFFRFFDGQADFAVVNADNLNFNLLTFREVFSYVVDIS